MSEEELYDIEKILDRRFINGRYEYKIKWEGYPMSQCTWEPLDNLYNAEDLVIEYNNEHPFKDPFESSESTPKKKTRKKIINTFINNKRKESTPSSSEKNIKNEKNKEIMVSNDNSSSTKEKDLIALNNFYQIKDKFIKVITVKKRKGILFAVVEKEENGVINKKLVSTEKLKKMNPWILLEFYESKIRFI